MKNMQNIAGQYNPEFGQCAQGIAPESTMLQVFREFDAAAREFSEACHDLQRAEQRKAAAFQHLKELSDAATKSIAVAVQDPTKDPEPLCNANQAKYTSFVTR